MSITWASAGSGVATESSGAACSPLWPATVNAGDIGIAEVYFEGTATAPDTPSGWTLLDGPRVIESTIGRMWVYGRIADGTEDGAAVAFGSQAVTTMRSARIHRYTGRVAGTITELVRGFAFLSHATDPQMPTVATTQAGALAVAHVVQNDNNTLGSATGASGGTWAEATAEFVSALTPGLVLQVQTCTPTGDPGTVSGGAVAATNDPSGVVAFEIRSSPVLAEEDDGGNWASVAQSGLACVAGAARAALLATAITAQAVAAQPQDELKFDPPPALGDDAQWEFLVNKPQATPQPFAVGDDLVALLPVEGQPLTYQAVLTPAPRVILMGGGTDEFAPATTTIVDDDAGFVPVPPRAPVTAPQLFTTGDELPAILPVDEQPATFAAVLAAAPRVVYVFGSIDEIVPQATSIVDDDPGAGLARFVESRAPVQPFTDTDAFVVSIVDDCDIGGAWPQRIPPARTDRLTLDLPDERIAPADTIFGNDEPDALPSVARSARPVQPFTADEEILPAAVTIVDEEPGVVRAAARAPKSALPLWFALPDERLPVLDDEVDGTLRAPRATVPLFSAFSDDDARIEPPPPMVDDDPGMSWLVRPPNASIAARLVAALAVVAATEDIVPSVAAATTFAGKYADEQASAYADLLAATPFSDEQSSAYSDLLDA